MADLVWPELWQPEAVAAAAPYVGTDDRLEILVDDPALAVSGTLLSGHLFPGEDGTVMIVHDRTGRPSVYPWRLLRGPVLLIKLLRPRRRALELFRNPLWRK